MRNVAFEKLFEVKMKTLSELMSDWKEYKKLENSVNAQRVAVEAEIYKLMMKQVKFPMEGTTNHEENGLKLKVVTKLSYSVDQDIAATMPHLFKQKFEYSKTLLKGLDDTQVQMLNEAVTVKPAKPSFSVEELKND